MCNSSFVSIRSHNSAKLFCMLNYRLWFIKTSISLNPAGKAAGVGTAARESPSQGEQRLSAI
jgi:hypothetical protein